jgi:integrase
MTGFNSVFCKELTEYLALRQKTFTPKTYSCRHSILADFDRYLAGLGPIEKAIPERIVNGWIAQLPEINTPRTISNKVSVIRKFLEYLRYCGYAVFIPGCPKYSDDYVPYLFSDEEVEKIFKTADNLNQQDCHSKNLYLLYEMPMLLRLLYGCGLRLGETVLIRIGDVNLNDGVLLLKNTKNKKQRIVPMSESLAEILLRYCEALRLTGTSSAFLFPTDKLGKHLSTATADAMFRIILQTAGIYIKPEPNKRGQCLNCFRHLFAVKSFAQAERDGRPIDDSVPFLSVYLGHYDMDGTEKYLKFNSDMFPEYTELFESYAIGVFSEVLYED